MDALLRKRRGWPARCAGVRIAALARAATQLPKVLRAEGRCPLAAPAAGLAGLAKPPPISMLAPDRSRDRNQGNLTDDEDVTRDDGADAAGGERELGRSAPQAPSPQPPSPSSPPYSRRALAAEAASGGGSGTGCGSPSEPLATRAGPQARARCLDVSKRRHLPAASADKDAPGAGSDSRRLHREADRWMVTRSPQSSCSRANYPSVS